jgi:hypothetical protein
VAARGGGGAHIFAQHSDAYDNHSAGAASVKHKRAHSAVDPKGVSEAGATQTMTKFVLEFAFGVWR